MKGMIDGALIDDDIEKCGEVGGFQQGGEMDHNVVESSTVVV